MLIALLLVLLGTLLGMGLTALGVNLTLRFMGPPAAGQLPR